MHTFIFSFSSQLAPLKHLYFENFPQSVKGMLALKPLTSSDILRWCGR